MTVYIADKGERHHSRPDCAAIIGAQRTTVTSVRAGRVTPLEDVCRTYRAPRQYAVPAAALTGGLW
ncbi:hypothetical protein [Streptomyces sp. CA-106110]|uniref:hypothetical protein n=1 Tax=Streptomyces sp. CA-106110 TaxID=3240044 RepID=UPI003D93DBB2